MPDDLFTGLNPAQQRAVQAVDGPVLVLAGPGSGKTRVLTHRVAYLIRALQVDPYQILAVTFTNKAAREMKQRLVHLVGEEAAYALTVGTFHSLCARFLRRDSVHLGRERDFVIYDGDDQERLMRRVVRELNLDEKKYAPRAMLARISSAKNELVGPAEYARLNRTYLDEIVARCYERYQQLLRQSNALDFDDLLVEMVHLFEQHPAVLGHYQRRYAYLLVDEYQDTNRAQYTLVKQLAAQRHNLFAVGDNDQSIYGWRGADIRNILQFEQDYPDAQVILLEQNYRSTQAILDTAQAVIAGGGKQKHRKNLWTDNGSGTKVSLHEGYDQDAEASFVADEIARLVASGEVSYGDCAVMYRVNAQSRALEEAFIQHGLRYQIIGGTRFYDRKEIRDVLAYLRLTANPYDNVALTRVLNWPPRGIGERSEAELTRWANELGVPLYQALREIEVGTSPFAARARSALLGFLANIDQILTMRNSLPLTDLFDAMMICLEVRETLLKEYDSEEAEDRWRNVQELRNVMNEYNHLPLESQLSTFLEEVALVAEVDKLEDKADAVTCITLHQAKGLEYPVVFLVGLEEGLLPHSRSLNEREQVEEERRLLYVGMTRARQRLYLCYAFRRATFGRSNITTRTRFLADIPKELLAQTKQQRKTTAPPAQSSMFTARSTIAGPPPKTAARPPRPAAPSSPTFAPGQHVHHPTFGDGVVVSSRLIENDEEVTVKFADKERRLLASFAKLEHLTG
ncbi:UvrD/REP helicase [Oscillochloris trichoides DG-6]|uniref:DNA 3'-5' helicase n=1 Tax=Oscillochloris trichoides DG-6 TaxID=765420 RepID=E1IIS8_9CHLR|nr:UvrD-helicase domain-containing protein [Oscillochloris trichoides]EFO78934.1 UvrD/REP helicase [Oscillochloris trichoides DG-6]